MPRKLPKYVRTKSAKGRTYYYFDTGQLNELGKPVLKRLPDIKDPGFSRACAAAATTRESREHTPNVLTVATLASLYEKSQEFAKLAPASRINYGTYLREARERFGIAPADDLKPEDVRIVRDKMADRPGAANMLIRTLGSLYKWGRRRQGLTANPVKDVDLLEQGEHEPWPEWLLEEALKDGAVQLPVALLYYTAQRIGDVCKMRWTDIREGAIEVEQQKTRTALTIPIHRDLAKLLDRTPKGSITILLRPDGKPWKPQELRRTLQAWAAGHDARIVPHGLRKNAVNALLEAGCSSAETAAISGQTLQVIEHYAKRRDKRVLGRAAILRWEGRNKA